MSESKTIEQWTFPLGENVAVLTLENQSGRPVEPEDMDALFEASLIFNKQLIRRYRARQSTPPEYQI